MPSTTAEAEPANAVIDEADAASLRRSTEREEMPLPSDARTVFLGGLFFLACMAALYVASEIVLPVILAIVLKLLLQPIVRMFDRVHVPRVLGALIAVLLLLAVFVGLGTALTRPAADWAGKLPDALPRLEQRLRFLVDPVDGIRRFLQEMERVAAAGPGVAPSPTVPVHPTGLAETLFSGTRAAAAGVFTTILVLFYLLLSGETFLRRLVEILPRFADKRRAVEISQHVERDISAYLITITLINAVVGLATTGVMWSFGVPDPLLWGVAAFVLNYVPILGPLLGVVLFALVGVLTLGAVWAALLPAALYLAIHLIEGEAITPLLLARRFTINPVAVVLSLVFWYWMWGVTGAVLSVPMLAITKIICDDLPPLRAFGHFLEG